MAKHINKKIIIVIIALSLGISLFLLQKSNLINLPFITNGDTNEARTSSSADTAQDDFSGANERDPGNTMGENRGSAVVTDTNGNIDSSIDTNKSTISKNGLIQVFSPLNDQTLVQDLEITGKSSLDRVSYRLIDNVSGLISAGTIKVVEGNFSGKLTFQTTASEGRLDIYSTTQDGVESENIEIQVRFR